MKHTTIVAAIALGLSGCVSTNQSDGGNYIRLPQTISSEAYKENYKVAHQPVTASDKKHVLFGLFEFGGSATHWANAVESPGLSFFPSAELNAKNGAFANACENAEADTILAARYKITKRNYLIYKNVEVEIKGFPAKITDLEKVALKENGK